MVPYTLSKQGRAVAAARRDLKKKAPRSRGARREASQDDSDSDEEGEEPVSFFSHLDTPIDPTPPNSSGDNASICSTSSMSGVGGILGDGVGRGSVEVAPSAPKPFNLETPGGIESESGYNFDPSLMARLWEGPDDASANAIAMGSHYSNTSSSVEEAGDQPHPPPAQPTLLSGAGPGLSMDDKAVSYGN